MGNYEKDTLIIPEDCDLIVSGSSTNPDTDDFFAQSGLSDLSDLSGLSAGKKILTRKQCFSPTDSSMDAAYSAQALKKICYIKLGQGKEYGKLIIHPKLI